MTPAAGELPRLLGLLPPIFQSKWSARYLDSCERRFCPGISLPVRHEDTRRRATGIQSHVLLRLRAAFRYRHRGKARTSAKWVQSAGPTRWRFSLCMDASCCRYSFTFMLVRLPRVDGEVMFLSEGFCGTRHAPFR